MLKRGRRKPKLKDAQDERMMGEDDETSRPQGAWIALNSYHSILPNANHFLLAVKLSFHFEYFLILYPVPDILRCSVYP